MPQEAPESKTANIKNKQYKISPELTELAQEVIRIKCLNIKPARITFVLVYPNINKWTAAQCMLANPMVTLLGDCDFVIQFSGELYDALSHELREILMHHELLHVVSTLNEKSGDWKFSLREHDVNEFREIIELHGLDWLSAVKNAFIESGGFEPDEVETISL